MQLLSACWALTRQAAHTEACNTRLNNFCFAVILPSPSSMAYSFAAFVSVCLACHLPCSWASRGCIPIIFTSIEHKTYCKVLCQQLTCKDRFSEDPTYMKELFILEVSDKKVDLWDVSVCFFIIIIFSCLLCVLQHAVRLPVAIALTTGSDDMLCESQPSCTVALSREKLKAQSYNGNTVRWHTLCSEQQCRWGVNHRAWHQLLLWV